MKSNKLFSGTVFLIAILFAAGALAGGHGGERPMKKGVLLAAFGSSIPEARVSFQTIEKRVKAAFPGVPVRWAYTSSIIRHKLARQGEQLDSIEMALARMMDEGFTHVAVQSLHTIPGEEYEDVHQTVHAFGSMNGGFDSIILGSPLLWVEEDLIRTAEAVIANIPAERKKDEAVVLMGHGTPHPSNAFYAAMMHHFQQRDPNIFVGTVEGGPLIDDIKAMLLEKKVKKVWLIPFMSVAGDHARNDMAGDEEDSWKSILTRAGMECVPVLKGTAEYNNIVEIWVDHLRVPMAHFKNSDL